MFKSSLKKGARTAFWLHTRNKGSGVESKILRKLEKGYEKLQQSNSKSLLKKHLTPELFNKLKTKRTKQATLLDCIQSGLTHHDSVCGIYAACPESYKVFAELFDPIIKDYHFGFKNTDKQPPEEFGDPYLFETIDQSNNFIASTRLHCFRSLKNYPFHPGMTVDHYNEIEDKLNCISSGFKGEFKGKFQYMDRAMQKRLKLERLPFIPDDRFLTAAEACRFWPTGRGVFRSFDGNFLVQCNAEDHLCITSLQRGGNFAVAYDRLLEGLCRVENYIPFARDDRLGFLTFCPTNLGTAMRASVHIKIPKLVASKSTLDGVLKRHKLQVQRASGAGDIYDVSNRRRLGITEFDAISELYCGIREIIKLEKKLPEVKKKPPPPPKYINPVDALKSGLYVDRKKKKASKESMKRLAKKPPAKKLSAKKPPPKTPPSTGAKTSPTKPASKKSEPKKPAAKKSEPKKPAAKKAETKKPAAKKAETKKPAAKKAEPKKPAAKKAETKKPSSKDATGKPEINKSKMKIAAVKTAAKKPTSKKSGSKKSPEKSSSKSDEPGTGKKSSLKCATKKTSKSSPKKSPETSKKSVESSCTPKKSKKKKSSDSTNPCTRAGLTMPKKKKESDPCKLEKKEKTPKDCKTSDTDCTKRCEADEEED